jgi:hypothetical protein
MYSLSVTKVSSNHFAADSLSVKWGLDGDDILVMQRAVANWAG